MPQGETNSQRAPNLIYCNQIKSVQATLFIVLESRARFLFGILGYGKLNANHFNIIQSCSCGQQLNLMIGAGRPCRD